MRLNKYCGYKAGGAQWLSEIPSHWFIYPLIGIANERIEPNSGMQEDNLLSLSFGRIVRKDIHSLDGLLPESFETYQIIRAGDVVLRLTDLQNDKRSLRSALVEEQGIITSAYLALRPVRVQSRFLAYILRAYDLIKVFYSMGGGLRQAMKFSDLKRLPIAMPSTEEQISIVAFLDRETAKIDALIAEQKKLIVLLAEKRQATITRAVTRGLDPSVPMRKSGVQWLGKMPAHWVAIPLKHLVSLKSGSTPSKDNLDYWNGDVPWASSKDLKLEQLAETSDRITKLAVESGVSTLVPPGALLIVVRGMILAKCFPVSETLVPLAINQDLKAIIPGKNITAPFLAWLLRGSADESLRRLDEAGHGTKALRMSAWTSMPLPLPPIDEQHAIALFLKSETSALDRSRSEAECAVTLLKERRNALIAAAVTGQIDVRGLMTHDVTSEETAPA